VMAGDSAKGLFGGAGARTLAEATTGSIVSVTRVGPDVRIEYSPR